MKALLLKVDPQIRKELLARFPAQEGAIEDYIALMDSIPIPAVGERFHDHHILPQKSFPQFADARRHPWNIRALSPQHHRVAHLSWKRVEPVAIHRIKMLIYVDVATREGLDRLSTKTGARLTELVRRAVKAYVKEANLDEKG